MERNAQASDAARGVKALEGAGAEASGRAATRGELREGARAFAMMVEREGEGSCLSLVVLDACLGFFGSDACDGYFERTRVEDFATLVCGGWR